MKLTRILKEGMAGNDVKYLQGKLEKLKFYTYGVLTGNFGPVTKKSVKLFQSSNDLLDDGVVGRKTWYKLTKDDVKINQPKSKVKSKPKVKFKYKPTLVTAEGLEIYNEILPDNEYVKQKTKKKVIYLHHTAGGCFKGDTMVQLLNGSSIRIDDMLKDVEYWIYGCETNGNIIPCKAIGLGETKKVNKLIEVTLDNGSKEVCTLEHKWMLRDGSYIEANELKVNDSLMPLYKRLDKSGYEEIKNNMNGVWCKTHQISGKIEYVDDMYKQEQQMLMHHIDFDKLNNSTCRKSEHYPEITYNHKIIDIKIIELVDEMPVYDIYSPETNNFALSSGVFVHNSRPDWTIKSWDRDGKSNKPYRIATSYIMGRRASSNGDDSFDGKVFKSFDDKYWAYHLGIKGSKGKYDKNSIGIEICNYGYCRVVDGKFINYVGREIPEDEVTDLGKEFRGFRYWEKYTDEQIENLRKLLIYLIDKHDIEYEKGIYDWDWFDYQPEKMDTNGIKTHVQSRKDKTDCYPCPRLIKMLNNL